MVPCKDAHYCIALSLSVCCILWSLPYANAQRFDVRPRSDIARHQRYILVLQALDKAAEEAVQACQTSNEQMTCAMAQLAIQAFHDGNEAVQDCLVGNEEACSILDHEVEMLGGQLPSSPAPPQSPMQRFSGGDRAVSCEEAKVQYNVCMSRVPRLSDEIRSGGMQTPRAARAAARAACEDVLAPCALAGGGRPGFGSGWGSGSDSCLARCQQYSAQEAACTRQYVDGNVYAGGPSNVQARENCRNAAVEAQRNCMASCR